MRYLAGLILILCCLSPSSAQNKDTLLVNLTNFKLYPGTFSWRGTNTYSHIIGNWDTSPYTEGHLKQGSVFRMNYRLLKPVGYDANYSPGYPMIVMLHGGGERGNCWDTNCYYGTPSYSVTHEPTGATPTQLTWLMNNDHVLSNGGLAHLNAVNLAGSTKPNDPNLNGRAFPGFVLFPQNINGWGNEASSNSDISFAIRIVRLISRQYNIDPNRIYLHGLSFGGQGVYKAMNLADWLFAASATMSAIYTNNIEVDSMSNIPLWAFQGGQDTQVTPSQTDLMLTKFRNAGGVARYTLYPSLGHGTWNSAYAEPDFFIWLMAHNKSNIHVPFNNPYICGTTGAGVKLTLTQGFFAYQWEKDGKIISGSNSYTYMANEPGVYRARFSRISKTPTEQQWNRWSDPVTISEKSPDKPIITQVNSIVLNDINSNKNATLKAPAGFAHYYWYKNGVASTLPDASSVTINGCSIQPSFPCAQSGAYTLVTSGIEQCPSLPSAAKYVILGMSSATNPLPVITKPSTFAGKVTSPSSVLLTWVDVAKNERGYEIWRRKSSDAANQWKMAVLTEEDVTLFHDTGLDPGTTYYYKIRGVNNEGRSDYAPANGTTGATSLIITTTTDTQIPTPPQNLVATVIGINKIALTWGASTDDSGIKDYYVYYNTDSVLVGSAATTFTLDNSRLVLNTYYNFTVRAVDLYGNLSSKSNQVSANTFVDGLYYEHSTGAWTDINTIPFLTAVPEFTGHVPNITLAPRTQDDFFNFRFYGYLYLNTGSTANTTSVNTTYAFRLSSNDGAELWIDDVRLIQRRFTVADGACTSNQAQTLQLAAGYHKIEVRYYEYTGSECLKLEYRGPDTKTSSANAPYVVVPDNKLKSYNVQTPPVAPIAPINLSATAVSMTQINLAWEFTGALPVNYEVYRSTSVSGSYAMAGRVSTTSFSDQNLIPGTTYYYKVRTVTNNGTSSYTSIVNATTLSDTAAPTQPTSLAVVNSTFTKASLVWTSSTDNVKVTGYEIWGNGILLGTSTVAGYLAINLTPNTFYSFTVIAYDASNNKSVASSPATTTTSTPDIYYSAPSGNLNSVTTWGKNTDGSGATASSFSNNGQYFVVSNRSTSSLGGTWSVEGSISKVIVPSDVTLTVDNVFDARVEVQDNGKLELNHSTVPAFISLSSTSTVNYNTPTNIVQNNYGNLGLTGTGNKVFPSSALTISGNLTASNGIALKGVSGNNSKILLGGNLTFNGTPASTAADYGIQLEFTKNGTQTITTGGDIYFHSMKTNGSTSVNVVNAGTPVTINLGSYAGGGLSIANGTLFNLGNNNLSLTHSAYINGAGENGKIGINGGSITVATNSSQNSNLYFDATNNKIKNLGIDLTGTGDLIFGEDASVSDGIKISNGELNSNGHITLMSNASKTASIQEIEGNGTITGDMKVQRYLDPKGKIYRYIATSVEGITVADWQKFFPITGGFTGGSTGFTNNPSMFNYDNGAWLAYPPASGNNLAPISRGVGYAAFLRNGASPITLEVTGNPFQGDVTFDLDPDPSPSVSTDGWNLLGNPYASTIVWGQTGWVKSGVSTSVSVRDNPTGDFKYYDYVTGLGTLTLGEIAPGQAFWVQSITANPSLTITEKAKTNAQQTLYRKADNPVSHLTLTLKQGLKADHAFVALTEFGTDGFDNEYDAVKQQNEGLFNFSTLTSNDVSVAINNMSNGFCSKTIKLNIQGVSAGSYAVIFDDVESLIGVGTVSLHDNFTNTDFDVTEGAQYNFAITSNVNSYGKNRFLLNLSRPAIHTDLSVSSANVCGDNYATIELGNTQDGVEYFAMNNNERISDIVRSSGSNVSLQIPANKLIAGNNQIQISAGFNGCDNKIIQTSAEFKYTEVPSVSVEQYEVWICQGSQTILTASGAPDNGHYKWYDRNSIEISNETASILETSLIKNDTEFYVASVTENGCEGVKKLISVFVESSDQPSIELKNDTLVSNGYGSLQWYKNGEPIPGATTNIFLPETSGSYSIAELGLSCKTESDPYEYLVTGNESENIHGFVLSVYPNPTKNGNINVSITSQCSKVVEVKLVDILGKSLFVNSFNTHQTEKGIKLEVQETLRSGIYFVTATQGTHVIKKKIIVTE
jgi:fibronectin type 3 domain-containing protein/predicted esterase